MLQHYYLEAAIAAGVIDAGEFQNSEAPRGADPVTPPAGVNGQLDLLASEE